MHYCHERGRMLNNSLKFCFHGVPILFNLYSFQSGSESCSIVSDPLWPHGLYSPWILQARIMESVAFPFSSGSAQPRDWIQVSCTAGGFFTNWAIRDFISKHISHYLFNVGERIAWLIRTSPGSQLNPSQSCFLL